MQTNLNLIKQGLQKAKSMEERKKQLTSILLKMIDNMLGENGNKRNDLEKSIYSSNLWFYDIYAIGLKEFPNKVQDQIMQNMKTTPMYLFSVILNYFYKYKPIEVNKKILNLQFASRVRLNNPKTMTITQIKQILRNRLLNNMIRKEIEQKQSTKILLGKNRFKQSDEFRSNVNDFVAGLSGTTHKLILLFKKYYTYSTYEDLEIYIDGIIKFLVPLHHSKSEVLNAIYLMSYNKNSNMNRHLITYLKKTNNNKAIIRRKFYINYHKK